MHSCQMHCQKKSRPTYQSVPDKIVGEGTSLLLCIPLFLYRFDFTQLNHANYAFNLDLVHNKHNVTSSQRNGLECFFLVVKRDTAVTRQ